MFFLDLVLTLITDKKPKIVYKCVLYDQTLKRVIVIRLNCYNRFQSLTERDTSRLIVMFFYGKQRAFLWHCGNSCSLYAIGIWQMKL